MNKYLVTFHKVVSDDTGHDHRIVQRRALVYAFSDVAASYEAKAIFCQVMGVADWRLRADTCEIARMAEAA